MMPAAFSVAMASAYNGARKEGSSRSWPPIVDPQHANLARHGEIGDFEVRSSVHDGGRDAGRRAGQSIREHRLPTHYDRDPSLTGA